MKIGVVYGNPETTTGGVALKFYASVRLEVRRGSAIREGNTVLGNETTIKVVKNKVAPPFREAKVDIIYGQGSEHANELFNLAVSENMIDRKGAWYAYMTPDNSEVSLGQGKANGVEFLKENPELMLEIENMAKTKFGLPLLEVKKEEKEDTSDGQIQ
jgi:recombination protein RecA